MRRLIKPLYWLLSRLPLSALHALGAMVGNLVWLLSPSVRARSHENLALAYPDGIPPGVARQAVVSAGRGLFELPWLWTRPIAETAARVVEVEGYAPVEAALQAGAPILFLTPHVGCFEVSAQFVGLHYPVMVLYRPPRIVELAPLREAGRVRGKMTAAPADTSGVRMMLRALKRGEAVGMLPDQVPQFGEGVWAPFFGKPAYTMSLAARFASVAGVRVVMAYAERLAGGRYRMVFRMPDAPLEQDLIERVAQLNREIEAIIRQCPQQYLWSYNRYKRPAGVAAPEENQ